MSDLVKSHAGRGVDIVLEDETVYLDFLKAMTAQDSSVRMEATRKVNASSCGQCHGFEVPATRVRSAF
jgi:mono/diheme cytochrome c family protein